MSNERIYFYLTVKMDKELRYIKRTNSICMNKEPCHIACPNDYPVTLLSRLMKELFPYREIIGYNSWIYIITTGFEYRKFSDTTISINDERGYEYYHGPYTDCYRNGIIRATLLIDENRDCYQIDLSRGLIYELMKYGPNYINLGRMIFVIDATFNPKNNQICMTNKNDADYKIAKEFIPFISLDRPISDITGIYCLRPPQHIINFIRENIELIKVDLSIDHSIYPKVTIKYVPKNKKIKDCSKDDKYKDDDESVCLNVCPNVCPDVCSKDDGSKDDDESDCPKDGEFVCPSDCSKDDSSDRSKDDDLI